MIVDDYRTIDYHPGSIPGGSTLIVIIGQSMEFLIPFKSGPETPERDINLSKCTRQLERYGYKYSVIRDTEPFNRAKLLNEGIKQTDDPLFFCLDCDIIVPQDFEILLEDVLKYYDIFFPICLNESQNCNYTWRHSGLGLVGCKKEIWDKYELKWNEGRTTWGGEDNDLYKDCQTKAMKIARFWCPGLIHQWHPESLEYKNLNAVLTT